MVEQRRVRCPVCAKVCAKVCAQVAGLDAAAEVFLAGLVVETATAARSIAEIG